LLLQCRRVPGVGLRTHILVVIKVDANSGGGIEAEDVVVGHRADVLALLFPAVLARLVRLLGQLEHGLVLGLPLVDP